MEKSELKSKTIHYYEFFSCRDYIKAKYSISDEDMGVFWNYLFEYWDWHNDSFNEIYFDEVSKPTKEKIAEIWQLFKDEFNDPEKDIQFYVSW